MNKCRKALSFAVMLGPHLAGDPEMHFTYVLTNR